MIIGIFTPLLRMLHRRSASTADVIYSQAVYEPKLEGMSADDLASELDKLSLEHEPYSYADTLLYEAAMRLRSK